MATLAAVPGLRRLLPVLLLTVTLLAVPAMASARVPQGFVGMMADGPLFDRHVNLSRQFDTMVGSGVESLRIVFNWSVAQPYPSFAAAPPSKRSHYANVGGVPTDWSTTDGQVIQAAAHGLTIMPTVMWAPAWGGQVNSTSGGYFMPRSGPYAAFVAALARRYGPQGTLWSANPRLRRLPIRLWQVWNEPNLSQYWQPSDFPGGYVNVLRATRSAVRGVDPGAKIVLAGMPNKSWEDLARIYQVPGARSAFDVAAVHPFTAQPAGVLTILSLVRDAMRAAGDGNKPLIASEISYPSAVGKGSQHYPFSTTESGQAHNLGVLLSLLASHRNSLHLMAFYHYTWVGREHRGDKDFSFAGLFRFNGTGLVTKPAFGAFRHAALGMEGCRVKGPVATHCSRR